MNCIETITDNVIGMNVMNMLYFAFCIILLVQLVTVFFGITCGPGSHRTVPYYKKQCLKYL